MHRQRHRLHVDYSERNAPLLELARLSGVFDVQMVHLDIGDYLIDGGVIIERKTYADFGISLAAVDCFHKLRGLPIAPIDRLC